MGAWDYQVMSNDDALDTIDLFVSSENLSEYLKIFLHENHYINEFLLAVEIIDISLNGIDEAILGCMYDYEDWFLDLEQHPMPELKNDAIHVIQFIQKHEEENICWTEDVREERKELLKQIERRLQSYECNMCKRPY